MDPSQSFSSPPFLPSSTPQYPQLAPMPPVYAAAPPPTAAAAGGVAAAAGVAAGAAGTSSSNYEQVKPDEGMTPSSTARFIRGLDKFQSSEDMDLTEFSLAHSSELKFPEKLMLLLSYIEKKYKTDPPISWTEDGNAFVIYNRQVVTDTILPFFFGPGKFASFTRKLYRWGFRQIGKPEQRINKAKAVTEYGHIYFQRDNKHLMSKMRSITAADRKRAEKRKAKQERANIILQGLGMSCPAAAPANRVMVHIAPRDESAFAVAAGARGEAETNSPNQDIKQYVESKEVVEETNRKRAASYELEKDAAIEVQRREALPANQRVKKDISDSRLQPSGQPTGGPIVHGRQNSAVAQPPVTSNEAASDDLQNEGTTTMSAVDQLCLQNAQLAALQQAQQHRRLQIAQQNAVAYHQGVIQLPYQGPYFVHPESLIQNPNHSNGLMEGLPLGYDPQWQRWHPPSSSQIRSVAQGNLQSHNVLPHGTLNALFQGAREQRQTPGGGVDDNLTPAASQAPAFPAGNAARPDEVASLRAEPPARPPQTMAVSNAGRTSAPSSQMHHQQQITGDAADDSQDREDGSQVQPGTIDLSHVATRTHPPQATPNLNQVRTALPPIQVLYQQQPVIGNWEHGYIQDRNHVYVVPPVLQDSPYLASSNSIGASESVNAPPPTRTVDPVTPNQDSALLPAGARQSQQRSLQRNPTQGYSEGAMGAPYCLHLGRPAQDSLLLSDPADMVGLGELSMPLYAVPPTFIPYQGGITLPATLIQLGGPDIVNRMPGYLYNESAGVTNSNVPRCDQDTSGRESQVCPNAVGSSMQPESDPSAAALTEGSS